ncbi:MAG: hypothetical protein GF372_14695, partial [Candidatus Marinimicrobia bacterium]|nr:hypothetical protein [Candidatus Neomarinimicrobiota bacterium]
MRLRIVRKVIIPVLALLIAGSGFVGCGTSDDNLQPLEYTGPVPGLLVGPYYLTQDSMISITPDFNASQSGISSNNNFKMTAELAIEIFNQTNDTLIFEPIKITVYTISGGNYFEIGTAELVPVISANPERVEKIPPKEYRELFYENNPFDEL